MTEKKHGFTCPKCGGHWFGSSSKTVYCHDQHQTGCSWEGDYDTYVDNSDLPMVLSPPPTIKWKHWPEEKPHPSCNNPILCARRDHFWASCAANMYSPSGDIYYHDPFYWCYEADLLATIPKGDK